MDVDGGSGGGGIGYSIDQVDGLVFGGSISAVSPSAKRS